MIGFVTNVIPRRLFSMPFRDVNLEYAKTVYIVGELFVLHTHDGILKSQLGIPLLFEQ